MNNMFINSFLEKSMINRKTLKNSTDIKITNFLNTIFCVEGEMCAENGEDSHSFDCVGKVGFIAAFDGCGGLGARKYDKLEYKTGAYIASRAAANATLRVFQDSFKDIKTLRQGATEAMAKHIYNVFKNELEGFKQYCEIQGHRIKGSMLKEFPTTASIVIYNCDEKKLECAFLWAGDSRGYILTPDGLSQYTRDDIDGMEDALSNLSKDSRLNNVVSAEGDFIINNRFVEVHYPVVLITSTDGCYNYFCTPMEFEFMIVKTLVESSSINMWKEKLKDYLLKYACDDFTIVIAVLGWKDFEGLRFAFEERLSYLENKFIEPLKKVQPLDAGRIGNDRTEDLWNMYKTTYYK